jgi:Methyltransferase domain
MAISGLFLKERGHCVVDVETVSRSGPKRASTMTDFISSISKSPNFPYRGEFDVILFADILEHVRDPAAVLRRSLPCLGPNGETIISPPDDSDRGMRDRSYRRFFTLGGIKRLMSDSSCRIRDLISTPLPIQLVFPVTEHCLFAPMHELHYLLIRTWRTLFAYQFILSVTAD